MERHTPRTAPEATGCPRRLVGQAPGKWRTARKGISEFMNGVTDARDRVDEMSTREADVLVRIRWHNGQHRSAIHLAVRLPDGSYRLYCTRQTPTAAQIDVVPPGVRGRTCWRCGKAAARVQRDGETSLPRERGC